MALPADYVDNGVTGKPDMSRLMIPSHTLPENYSFDADAMEGFEMEYGDGENFKSTTLFWKLPVLCDGEELLWSYVGEQGVFNKKARHLMAVTNFRAYVYHFEEHDWGNVLISTLDDILVMNSHRQSSSHRMGSFHATGRMGMSVGTHSSMGSSRSQTVGDVHFMKDGETIVTFGNVSDPSGIVKLVKSIQKQVTVRDKVDETKSLVENTYVDNRTILKISELYHQGNEQEAVKICDDALKSHPDDEAIFKIKLAHCEDTGNWKQMVVDSRNMLLLKEYEPAFEYLMTGLIKLDKTNDAIDELRRGLELFPENTILLDLKKQLDDFEANNLLDNITCPKCKKDNESNSKFCNKCGTKFDDGCEKCGNVNPKNSKFCNGCGSTLV
jgi:tetratricopeptide (TPR) repeat protein